MIGNIAGGLHSALPSPNFDVKNGPQESLFRQNGQSQYPLWFSWQNYHSPLWSSWKKQLPVGTTFSHPPTNTPVYGQVTSSWAPRSYHTFQQTSINSCRSPAFRERTNKGPYFSTPKPFCCDPCNKAYADKQELDEHLAEHVECRVGGCSFKAHPKIVALHQKMQHETGLAKKIMSLDTPEEIRKWREERRRNFPTAANIAKRKAEAAEKEARGEVLETKEFGKIRRPLRGRGSFRGSGWRGFHPEVSISVQSLNDKRTQLSSNGARARWCRHRPRVRRQRQRNASRKISVNTESLLEKRTAHNNIVEENVEDCKRGLKRFRGTLYNYENNTKECFDGDTRSGEQPTTNCGSLVTSITSVNTVSTSSQVELHCEPKSDDVILTSCATSLCEVRANDVILETDITCTVHNNCGQNSVELVEEIDEKEPKGMETTNDLNDSLSESSADSEGEEPHDTTNSLLQNKFQHEPKGVETINDLDVSSSESSTDSEGEQPHDTTSSLLQNECVHVLDKLDNALNSDVNDDDGTPLNTEVKTRLIHDSASSLPAEWKISVSKVQKDEEKEEGELTDTDEEPSIFFENENSDIKTVMNGHTEERKHTSPEGSLENQLSSQNLSIEDLDDMDGSPVSMPVNRLAPSPPLHSQLGGSLGLLMSSYANSDSESEGEIRSDEENTKKQPEKVKKITKQVNSFPVNRRRSTLLEKLLANEIRHERNVILQCVRYIVKKNFFKIQ